MKYETLRGRVEKIVRTSSVSGDKKSTWTSHKTGFRIAGKQAEYGGQIELGEGDQVVIAGYFERSGVFRARAIYNSENGITTGSGEIRWWEYALTIAVLPIIAIPIILIIGIPIGGAALAFLIIQWVGRYRDRNAMRVLQAELQQQGTLATA